MPTKEEINAKYLDLHTKLGTRKQATDKGEFDKKHQDLWAKCDAELKKAGYLKEF